MRRRSPKFVAVWTEFPLAIELAAARVGAFGVTAVSAGLTNMFWLLVQGRRTALARHQTLRATHSRLEPRTPADV